MNIIYQSKLGADRFAKFDLSISRIRIAASHQPCATCAMIYCLKQNDNEAAELIAKSILGAALEWLYESENQ